MTIDLEILRDCQGSNEPGDEAFNQWVEAALAGQTGSFSLAIRLIDKQESRRLNLKYRDIDQPTNVLSFPSDLPREVLQELPFQPLGDLAICAPLLQSQALEQDKPENDHWAHLTIHGVLHLLGHDHQEALQAAEMENLETRILQGFGIASPWS